MDGSCVCVCLCGWIYFPLLLSVQCVFVSFALAHGVRTNFFSFSPCFCWFFFHRFRLEHADFCLQTKATICIEKWRKLCIQVQIHMHARSLVQQTIYTIDLNIYFLHKMRNKYTDNSNFRRVSSLFRYKHLHLGMFCVVIGGYICSVCL